MSLTESLSHVYERAVAAEGKKVLVVYYSRTEHSKLFAEAIEEQLFSKGMVPVVEVLESDRAAPGCWGYCVSCLDALLGKEYQLKKPIVNNVKNYKTVIFGGPVWGWGINNVIQAWIKQVKSDFDYSKTVVGFFANAGGSGLEKTKAHVKKLGVNFDESLAVVETDIAKDEFKASVQKFVESLLAATPSGSKKEGSKTPKKE